MSVGYLQRRVGAFLFLICISVFSAIAIAAQPPISVYGKLPGFEQAAMSPSGERIALVGVLGETRSLIVVDRSKTPLLVVEIGDQKLRSVSWAGENRVLVRIDTTIRLGIGFTTDKAELSGMMVVPIGTGEPWTIFGGTREITGGIRGFYGVVERAGRWYGYFGGITLTSTRAGDHYLGNTNPDLYEVDLETGKASRIARRFDSDQGFRTWLVGPDGAVAASFDFLSDSGSWRIRNAQGATIASGLKPRGGVDIVSFGRSPGTLLYRLDDEASGGSIWYELPLAGGTPTQVLQGESVGGNYTDPRSRLLIGHVRDADVPVARFYDSRHEKVMAATRRAFPGLNLELIDWNDAFDRLIVRTDGASDPGTWWLVDIATGDATVLGVSYTIAAADVGPVRMIRYKAGDGLEITGVLTLPPGREAKDLPVVILPHGGPSARDYPAFDWWAQAFATRGYTVFQPNFRGSTGYGAAFERAGHGEWGRKMQTDISEGLAELARQGIVDAKRACIMGASYGGYAALAGVTLQQGLYRCAVSVAGVSDVGRLYDSDVSASGYDQTLIRALKAEIGSGRDLAAISPIRFADRADAPILLIHGKDDTRVRYDQSAAMARALRSAGKPVELVTLPGEDHYLSKSATRLAMLEAAIAFVERYNAAQ